MIEIEIPIAADRRAYDPDGRLSVTGCTITAAQVNPYLGHEIPEFEALGLDPDRIYYLYRDAAALKTAVPLFDGIPLLIEHAPVTAADPKQQLVVGTVRDSAWRNNKVVATLSVWNQEAIDGIKSNARRDLSCGYRYTPRMTPGTTPNGETFDGRMLDIVPNHCALVDTGRVSGAMVADARPQLTGDNILASIAADRARVRRAQENTVLGRLGYYRLP